MPVDDAQPGDRPFTDVLVDDIGLLHARLLAAGHRLVVNPDGGNGRRGLRFEAETAADATPGGILRVLEADVIRGARFHRRPELELLGTDGLEGDRYRRRDAEGLLNGSGLHLLVEVQIDGRGP